jgi:hypothetical protein
MKKTGDGQQVQRDGRHGVFQQRLQLSIEDFGPRLSKIIFSRFSVIFHYKSSFLNTSNKLRCLKYEKAA